MYDEELNELKKKVDIAIAPKTKNYVRGYKQGRADVLKDLAKIIDDWGCGRDVKPNVSLSQMINTYIYEQTKEQNK